MKPKKSPADLADLRRLTPKQQNHIKLTTNPNCLSLRYNAACCIPLRDLRNLRENIHARVLNLYCTNENPMYPADLADLRRQTTKHRTTIITQSVFLCVIMQPAAFLCVICVICGRITRKSTQSILHQTKPQ